MTFVVTSPTLSPPLSSNKKFSFLTLFFLFLFFLLLLFSGLYFFFLSPKLIAKNFLQELLTSLSEFKLAFQNLHQSTDKIYFLLTQEIKFDLKEEPKISFLPNQNLLGLETKKGGFWEETIRQMIKEGKENPNSSPSSGKIQGLTSSENLYLQNLRSLKEETLKNEELRKQAWEKFDNFWQKSQSIPPRSPQNFLEKIKERETLRKKSQAYFSEVKKISDYFQQLSTILIAIQPKLITFHNSLSMIISLVESSPEDSKSNNSLSFLKSRVSQMEIFLEEAKENSQEISSLTENLAKYPADLLPEKIAPYHQHNLAVFRVLTDYFTSLSTGFEGVINVNRSLLGKIKNQTLSEGDLNNFRVIFTETGNFLDQAETKFLADSQTLFGEETSLALSFWQDNPIFSLSSQIGEETISLEKTLRQLLKEEKIPFLEN